MRNKVDFKTKRDLIRINSRKEQDSIYLVIDLKKELIDTHIRSEDDNVYDDYKNEFYLFHLAFDVDAKKLEAFVDDELIAKLNTLDLKDDDQYAELVDFIDARAPRQNFCDAFIDAKRWFAIYPKNEETILDALHDEITDEEIETLAYIEYERASSYYLTVADDFKEYILNLKKEK